MSCPCRELGAYVDGFDSTSGPDYIVEACDDHRLPLDPANAIEADDAAAMRVDECLEAVAAVRDILWPDGNPDAEWTPETIEDVARALNFLRPAHDDSPGSADGYKHAGDVALCIEAGDHLKETDRDGDCTACGCGP